MMMGAGVCIGDSGIGAPRTDLAHVRGQERSLAIGGREEGKYRRSTAAGAETNDGDNERESETRGVAEPLGPGRSVRGPDD